MSAVIAENQSRDSKTVLPFASMVRQEFKKYLEGIAALEPKLIADLQAQEEADILKTREGAALLETHGWRIKCACDAALWDKTVAAKRGRGNKDVHQKGILSAVSRRSKKIGVTPTTIYRNAQIFRLMESVKQAQPQEILCSEHNILEVLDEKGFYDAALTAADPLKALHIFTERKEAQSRFRVTDAQRLVVAEGLSRKAVSEKTREKILRKDSKSLAEHIKAAREIIIRDIIPTCPSMEFEERVWDEILADLQDEYDEVVTAEAQDLLRKAWDEGARREDQMAQRTGFPQRDISQYMNSLADLSEFIRVQPRDIAARSSYQLWHRVGRPFDNANLIPMTRKE